MAYTNIGEVVNIQDFVKDTIMSVKGVEVPKQEVSVEKIIQSLYLLDKLCLKALFATRFILFRIN